MCEQIWESYSWENIWWDIVSFLVDKNISSEVRLEIIEKFDDMGLSGRKLKVHHEVEEIGILHCVVILIRNFHLVMGKKHTNGYRYYINLTKKITVW